MGDWESITEDEAIDTAETLGQSLRDCNGELKRAVKLLEYALHLRRHGERAPGGTETWAQFDRDAETFLRGRHSERHAGMGLPCSEEGGKPCTIDEKIGESQ